MRWQVMRTRRWQWHRYESKGADTGVAFYAVEEDAIALRFKSDDRHFYVYSYYAPGAQHVAQMKKLAPAGRGLTTYVNQHVRNNYAAKLPVRNPARLVPRTPKPGLRRAS
jgi:hypothetical protein